MKRTGRHASLAILILSVACGRTELSSTTTDARAISPFDSGIGPVDYKIAYLASDAITPLRVWHSRTGALEKLPWSHTGWLAFTYDGSRVVALDYPCVVVVQDENGNLLRSQVLPIPHGHPQCREISPRGSDASRILVAGDWQDSFAPDEVATPFVATLDSKGNYSEIDGHDWAAFHYAPDGQTVAFFDWDARTIDTMLDDGSDRKELVAGGAASFSFDQQQLVFVSARDGGPAAGLDTVDLASRAVRPLGVQVRSELPQPQFTPDGRSIVFVEQSQTHVNPPAYSLRRYSFTSGKVETIVEDTGAHGYLPPTFSLAEDHDG